MRAQSSNGLLLGQVMGPQEWEAAPVVNKRLEC